MPDHEIARFPPVLQIAALGLLAAYVALSILGRASRRLRGLLWADPADSRTLEHLLEYTIVPALVLAGAIAGVVVNWNPGAALDGGWTMRELTVGPMTAALGVVVIVFGTVAGRRIHTSDTSAPGAWIPFAAILLGIALLAVGVTTLGRTVKRASGGEPQSPASARVHDR